MTRQTTETSLDEALTHLRNKNLEVFPARRSILLSLPDRLAQRGTSLRRRALGRGSWEVVVSEQTEAVVLVRRDKPAS